MKDTLYLQRHIVFFIENDNLLVMFFGVVRSGRNNIRWDFDYLPQSN
jgi:hypothetical protein